ncbi:MAG: acyl-CoA dehydrogenase, partial [Acidimicrobiales bacterium]
AWGTDLGVELTSVAVQVHGGMGYIEETGVAQHYRDARIAPIYEGTNGIQAIDLVGRKLPMRAGGVVNDFLDGIAATADELVASDGDLPAIGKNLAEAQATLRQTTDWLLANGRVDPDNALAGATPYLRMCGVVTGGWLLARSAHAAVRALDAGRGDAGFLRQKVVTARFYAEQLLPQAAGLAPAVTAGPADLTAAVF